MGSLWPSTRCHHCFQKASPWVVIPWLSTYHEGYIPRPQWILEQCTVLTLFPLARKELSLSAGWLQLEPKRRETSPPLGIGNSTGTPLCSLKESRFSPQQVEITLSTLIRMMETNMEIV
jgi:hypothetical protein